MKINTVKNIIIFFLVFLPLQYAVVGIVGLKGSEPWPALVFPAFKSVLRPSDIVSQTKPVFKLKTESQSQIIETKKLLNGLMPVQQRDFLENNFLDSSQVNQSTIQWLKGRIHKAYPNVGPLQWLRIQWVKQRYRLHGNRVEPDSQRTVTAFKIRF